MFYSTYIKGFRSALVAITVLGFMIATIQSRPVSAQTPAPFEDTFANNSAGWTSATFDLYTRVRNGILYLTQGGSDVFSYAVPNKTFPADSEIEVEGRLVSVPQTPDSNVSWGLIFRAPGNIDFSNQLYFVLENQSAWNFYSTDSTSKYRSIRSGFFSEKLDLTQYHRLKVIMRGNTFELFVDGERLYGFTDTSNTNRPAKLTYAGITVGNGAEAGAIKAAIRMFKVSPLAVLPATATPTPRPKVTATPRPKFTPTPAPTITPVFQNLFGNASAWQVAGGNGKVSISDGKLTLDLEGDSEQSTWVASDGLQIPRDADITFTLDPIETPKIGRWNVGIGVRATGDKSARFHNLRLSSSKGYAFSYRQADLAKVYIEPGIALTVDWKIQNRVRVVVKGNTLSFYLNGIKVQDFTDETLTTTEDNFKFFLTGGLIPEDRNAVKLKATFSDLAVYSVP